MRMQPHCWTKHIRDVYDLSALYHNQEYNDYLHSEDFLDAMYRVTIEDGLNKKLPFALVAG